MKQFFVAGVLVVCTVCMGFLFWKQELQYVLPTPVPVNYVAKLPAEHISLPAEYNLPDSTALYLHFFNPDCPCSRFNLKHVKSLINQFNNNVKIYAVIPAYADVAHAKEMIDDERVTILHDTTDVLAKACGVYSTPQAVVIDADHKLFYRGNYNRARYCTLKETNYAEIALTALVNGEAQPVFNAMATQAYGCAFFSDQ